MKRSGLTEKQQLKAAEKVFRLLASVGFQYNAAGDYRWLKISEAERICVGFRIYDVLFQKPTDHWTWKTAPLTEEPRFGYSGSMSCGASFGTVERVLQTTFEQIRWAGVCDGLDMAHERTEKMKIEVRAALADLAKAID